MYTDCKLGRIFCACFFPHLNFFFFWGFRTLAMLLQVICVLLLAFTRSAAAAAAAAPDFITKQTHGFLTVVPARYAEGRGLPLGPSHGWFMRSKCNNTRKKMFYQASREISKVFAPLFPLHTHTYTYTEPLPSLAPTSKWFILCEILAEIPINFNSFLV